MMSSTPLLLPTPAPTTTSFWRRTLHPLDSHRSTPALPSVTDIAIIGAGYAGASVTYHVLQLDPSHKNSVLILEAREACSGATGRNGGHLKPDVFSIPATVARKYGANAGKEVGLFEMAHLDALQKVVQDGEVECDFVRTRCMDVCLTEERWEAVRRKVAYLRELGLEDELLGDLFMAEGDEAEQLSGVKGAVGCLSNSAGHLAPYKLVMHFLDRAVAAGVNLQTNTPVVDVTREGDENGYYTITTQDRGTVRARKVVFATNGYCAGLLPELEGRVIPVRGMCSHVEAMKGRAPHLPSSCVLRRGPIEYDYLIQRLDGSVVVGARTSEQYRDLGTWYANERDDERMSGGADGYFEGYMQRTFHGWEDSGAEVTGAWTGIMGYSADSLPFVGALPGRPNQFVLAGFTGHGMPQIFLSAKGIAEMVVCGIKFADTGVPMVFEVTSERLASETDDIKDMWKSFWRMEEASE